MTRIYLLWTTLIFSCLFLFHESIRGILPSKRFGFPFDDMTLSAENYLYYLFEKLIIVILAVVIWMNEKKYKFFAVLFLSISVIDVLDYVLFYGNLRLNNLITWNTAKVAIFGTAILYEHVRR